MPPAKRIPHEDVRSEASTVRERQIAAAAHARSKKQAAATAATAANNGSGLKELALVSTESGSVIAPGQSAGMQWNTADRELLNTYRVAHNLSTPAAFKSPLNQALLSNPGIGKQSPSMARRKDKRRVSKDQLALAVRKNFNAAAVSEIDVMVELLYKVRSQDKAFRLRSTPSMPKKGA